MFVYILLSLCALISEGAYGSEQAWEIVFSTSDSDKLAYIKSNPQAFWSERKTALTTGFTKVLSHEDFCVRYVREAQTYISEEAQTWQEKPWFAEGDPWFAKKEKPWFTDFSIIDGLIQSALPEDSPVRPNAMATFYAKACDYLNAPFKDDCYETMSTQGKFQAALRRFIAKNNDITHELNNKIKWLMTPSGECSFFDYLVMRSEGLLLSAAPFNFEDRNQFRKMPHAPVEGWFGVFTSRMTHAITQYRREKAMEELHGLDAQRYFNCCCNPGILEKENLIALADQIQGVFYNFHQEIPEDASSADDVLWLLLPTEEELTDAVFCRAVPYFLREQNPCGAEFDPRKHTLKFLGFSYYCVLTHLCKVRNKYCRPGKQLYMKELQSERVAFLLDQSEPGECVCPTKIGIQRQSAYLATQIEDALTTLLDQIWERRFCILQTKKIFVYAPGLAIKKIRASKSLKDLIKERWNGCVTEYQKDTFAEITFENVALATPVRIDYGAEIFWRESDDTCKRT